MCLCRSPYRSDRWSCYQTRGWRSRIHNYTRSRFHSSGRFSRRGSGRYSRHYHSRSRSKSRSRSRSRYVCVYHIYCAFLMTVDALLAATCTLWLCIEVLIIIEEGEDNLILMTVDQNLGQHFQISHYLLLQYIITPCMYNTLYRYMYNTLYRYMYNTLYRYMYNTLYRYMYMHVLQVCMYMYIFADLLITAVGKIEAGLMMVMWLLAM